MAPGPFGGPGGGFGGPGGRPPMGPPPGHRGTRDVIAATGFRPENQNPVAELDLKELEKQSEEMMSISFLTKDNAKFTPTDGGFLSLTYNGKTWDRIQIVQTFPFSDKNHFLSIRECTETAKEIGMIQNLEEDFPEEIVTYIEKDLSLRYFMPIILKIHSIHERHGYIYFTVQTEKGKQQFTVRNNSNAIIPFTEKRIFITDIENNRYEIPDTSRLSPKDLTKLDLYL